MSASDLAAKRDALVRKLQAMDVSEAEMRKLTMSTSIRELKRSTSQLLDRLDREEREREREEAEECEAALQAKLDAIEENTRPNDPPVYRSTLTPAQKSRLMRQLGSDRYLTLPWAPRR